MLKCKSTKKAIGWIGIICCIGISVVLYHAFLIAFLKGGSTVVYINVFGEMLLELILIPVLIVLGIYGLYIDMKKEIREI